ncbi:Histidinol-phosphate aminotransferase [subsurface metagenome]
MPPVYRKRSVPSRCTAASGREAPSRSSAARVAVTSETATYFILSYALTKFILALMNPGDEVLYPNPGYPIYESQIEFHGGKAVPYAYFEGAEGFELGIDSMESQITPRTKLLIVNDLQNPTGAECSAGERERLAELVLKHGLYVLCDEAYFDIRYEGKSYSLASLPGMGTMVPLVT